VLGGAGFLDETYVAMNFHVEVDHFNSPLGRKTFDDWRQVLVQRLVPGLAGAVTGMVRGIAGRCGHLGQRACAFDMGRHG
jgi:hypothetical protein